ncbi:hypothetical protein ACXR0O_28160 [Verrucomicrobiota bacterium sgz303538]
MRNGTGMSWLGAAGAFVLSWSVVRGIGVRQTAAHTPAPGPLELTASSDDAPLDSSRASRTQTLQGSALESEVNKIATLANRTTEEDGRYVKELYEFASRIPLKEFPRVLELLRKQGSKRTEQLRQELLAYWMEQNATAARSYIGTLSPQERQRLFNADHQFNPVADAWARADSEGLMSWLKSLPARERQALRDSVRDSIAQVLSHRDPAMAFSVLLKSPDGDNGSKGTIETMIFSEWVQRDPEAAAAQSLRLEAGTGRWVAINRVTAELLKKDQGTAMAWVRQIVNPDLAREAAITLASNLSNKDPERALVFAVEQGVADTPEAEYMRGQACWEWMKRDADRALEWVQRLDTGPTRDLIFSKMLSRAADEQPQRAAELFLAESAQGANLGNSARDIVRGLGKAGNVDATVSFLSKLPEAEQLRAADYAPYAILERLGADVAVDTGSQLPSGSLRDRWMQQSVESIAKEKGPQELQRVLERLPAGPDRNSLTSKAIAEVIRLKADPEAALALAQTLPNGHEYLMQGVAEWLKSSNPTPARNWIQQTKMFTPEEKQRLLQPVTTVTSAAPVGGSNNSGTQTNTRIPRP